MVMQRKKFEPESVERRRDCHKDRLSTLPDELLLKILCETVSYREAVKCSVLSKRWRHLYTKLPELHFIESEMIRDDVRQGETEKEKKRARRNLITKIASSALFSHKADVHIFSLEVIDDMKLWSWCLHWVGKYPLDSLTLWSSRTPSILHEFPFSCENLIFLSLENVQCLSLSNLDFPKLHECWLVLSNDYSFWYNEFLSKCPALYQLYIEAHFGSQQSPFTLSSPALRVLDLFTFDKNAMVMRIEAPMLQELSLGPDSILNVKVEAPTLQDLSIEFSGYKTWGNCIECNGAVWKDNLQVNRAKWNKDQKLVLLDIESTIVDGELSLGDLSLHPTLKVLRLTYFKICPLNFWEMLSRLPLLASLTLTYCTFEAEEFDVSREEDVDFYIFNTNGMENLVYTKKLYREPRLTEISVSIRKSEGLFRGARDMLQLFWQKATYLRKLIVNMDKQEGSSKAKCLKFFWHLMSSGDRVKLTNDDGFSVFHLTKKCPIEILTSS